MVPVSVVIITKNEAEVISACINAVRLITDDIIVIDNDSTDKTPEIAFISGCRVYHENWDGYGANKNKGVAYAKYNWILSIDADEIPDEELISALHQLEFGDTGTVYDIRFKSYYGKKPVRFGTWGRDHHIRLFNRKLVKWSEPSVHETLVLPSAITIKKLNGYIHHYSIKDSGELVTKTVRYAKLSAEKYAASGKKANMIKLHIAPIYHFLKNYIVLLGFLDGREGWQIAMMISKLTWLKYRLLKKQRKRSYQEKQVSGEALVVEY